MLSTLVLSNKNQTCREGKPPPLQAGEDVTIKPFLVENQAEVKRMCITEYNEERVFAQQRDEGRAEGRKEGALEMLISLVKKGLISFTQAAEEAHMTIEEFEQQSGLKA